MPDSSDSKDSKSDAIQPAAFGQDDLKPSLAETGTTGLRRYGGLIQEEFLPQLRGLQGVKVYDEMRKNDPTVGGMIRATKDVVLSVPWEVVAAGDTPADSNAAEFLESCMNDMSVAWKDVISEAITMVVFGWAYMEVVYKKRSGDKPKGSKPDTKGDDTANAINSTSVGTWGVGNAAGGPPQVATDTMAPIINSPLQPKDVTQSDPAKSKYEDGRIGWRKIALRGQETLYRWDIDQHGGIRAMEQFDPVVGGGIRVIPIEYALLFRTDREKNNPEGVSFLRWAYRAWYHKKQIEEIEAIGIERDLTGVPVITLPQGATTVMQTRALDMLRKLKADESSGIVLERGPSPDGRQDWTFELTNSPGSKALAPSQVIERYATEIAIGFLANFLRLGSTSTGSHALSKEQKDFFYLTITGLLDNIEETINRFLVRKLFNFNAFPGLEQLPEIKHGKVGQHELGQFIQSVKALADAGLLGPVDADLLQFLRQTLDMPELKQEQVDAMDAQEKAKTAADQAAAEQQAKDPMGLDLLKQKTEIAAKAAPLGTKPPPGGGPPRPGAGGAGARPGARSTVAKKPVTSPRALSVIEQVQRYLDERG